MSDVRSRLIRCFGAVFPEIPENKLPETSVDNTQNWDSINSLNLLRVIEEEFGVEIDFEDIENLTSFQALEGHLNGLTASNVSTTV